MLCTRPDCQGTTDGCRLGCISVPINPAQPGVMTINVPYVPPFAPSVADKYYNGLLQQLKAELEDARSRAENAEAEADRLRKLVRDNGTPRFNAVCERAEKAEATCEKLAAALVEIRDAHPTGSSWSLMNDGTWREAARDFQRIARFTLSEAGAEPR